MKNICKINKPRNLDRFIYGLMNETCYNDYIDFLEDYGVTDKEVNDIRVWFKKELDIEI